MKKIEAKPKRKLSNEEMLIRKSISILITVLALLGTMYLITHLIVNKGILSKGYEPPILEAAVIDYETSTIGTVFTKQDKEYYVLFDYFTSVSKKNSYIESILPIYNAKKDMPQLYKVDLNQSINEKYISTKSNIKANRSLDLKIKGVTLIKIKNGKNILYLDDIDKIAEELEIKTK